jgi:chemotaxis signal transduction protein
VTSSTDGTYVRVRVGREQYALPVADVAEVVERVALTSIPGGPPQVLGLRTLRGEVLPVIDLAAMLGIDAGSEPDRVIVAEVASHRCGLAVERVLDVAALPEVVPEANLLYVTGTALVDDQLVGILDTPRLFTSIERGTS